MIVSTLSIRSTFRTLFLGLFFCVGFFFILAPSAYGNVTSATGEIRFDVDADGTSEAKLESTGLAIGANSSPSANLQVEGNAIITTSLSVGSSTVGTSNLQITGTFGLSFEKVSDNATLGNHSLVLADSSSGNITVTLPDAGDVAGRLYIIKKTSTLNEITLTSVNTNDCNSSYTFSSGNMAYMKVQSANGVWYVLGQSRSGVSEVFPLFADCFNRGDNTLLNVVDTGKKGTLGALSWVEVVSAGDPQILSSQFKFGEAGGGGGGWSIAYVDHNFTETSIIASGEFTVSVDLVSPSSGGGTRFTGFAIGHSKAELDGWSANNPASFDSDFFIGYDTTGTKEVKIFINGGTQDHQEGTDLSVGATLSVRFSSITDFNSGSSVSYDASIDGSSIKTGAFTWSGNNENYLTLYSNYTSHQGLLDNFHVR